MSLNSSRRIWMMIRMIIWLTFKRKIEGNKIFFKFYKQIYIQRTRITKANITADNSW